MKFSQYNLYLEKEEKYLLANTRNSNCVRLTSKNDIEHLKELRENQIKIVIEDNMVKQLYDRGFIVDDDFDEFEEAKEDLHNFLDAQSKLLNLAIYVTDQCNFRCIYCPEIHESTRLSKDNWEKIYKYVTKSIKDGVYTHIKIDYAGGEPLLESKQILEFSAKLKEFLKNYPDIVYYSNIITNGSLLTPDLYDKMTEAGINNYMITVDGFKETHEKMRPAANGKPTWNVIINNLKYINTKEDDVEILLRANFNKINEHTLRDWEKYLKETFTNPKIKLQFHPVIHFSNNVKDEYLADPKGEGWNEFFAVGAKCKDEKNISHKHTPFRKFRYICDAAYRGSIAVSADGKISKCHNIMSKEEAADNLVGEFDNAGNIIYNIDIEKWHEGLEKEMCKTCAVYPICGARKCPARAYRERENDQQDITYCFYPVIMGGLESYLLENY